MLDNVINYNFPDKAKLFLHRVGGCGQDQVITGDYRSHVTIFCSGRVARAGRTGSAYSLVSTDELPYCIDLHLFISRPVIPAKLDLDDDISGKVKQLFSPFKSLFHSRSVWLCTTVHSG